jgi:hypothetical protein
VESPKTAPQVLAAGWLSFVSFVIPLFFDTLIGLSLFGVLLLFSWVFSLGRASGHVPKEYLHAYETIHAYGNLAIFTVMGLDYLVRVLRRIFRGGY